MRQDVSVLTPDVEVDSLVRDVRLPFRDERFLCGDRLGFARGSGRLRNQRLCSCDVRGACREQRQAEAASARRKTAPITYTHGEHRAFVKQH